MTLTHIAERLVVELSLPFLRLKSVAAGIRTPNLPRASRTLYPTDVFVLKLKYLSFLLAVFI